MQTQTNNPTPWELKALTVQLAQDVAQVKEMMLAKTQTDMMQALKRPRAPEEEDTAPPSPAQKKTKTAKPPRNANPWFSGYHSSIGRREAWVPYLQGVESS